MENEVSGHCCDRQFNCTHEGKCPKHPWRKFADGVSFDSSWGLVNGVPSGSGTPLPEESPAHSLDRMSTPASYAGCGPTEDV